ncbi:hypothetical protein GEO21_04245, partial [Sphingobacterium faecium]|uniref:EpsG family protein n=1 Tax=Sphingobacterium faecium TaxID=34087 RepID=UPI0012923A0B
FANIGLEYKNVFQLHIILIAIFYTFFAKKFLLNPFLVVIFFLFLTYVPLVNQIRYFVAFSFFLFAIHNFYIGDKKKFYLFAILALLNHIGTFPLFVILFFLKRDLKIKYYLGAAIAIYIVMYGIMSVSYLSELGGFNIYIKEEMRTSFLGGLLKILPSIIFVLLILRLKQTNLPSYQSTFLYRVSLFPIVFIPSATLTQIIGDRYVFIFSFIWLIFIFQKVYYNKKYMLFYKILMLIFVFMIWFIMYYLPVILFGQSHLLDELVKTFDSQF